MSYGDDGRGGRNDDYYSGSNGDDSADRRQGGGYGGGGRDDGYGGGQGQGGSYGGDERRHERRDDDGYGGGGQSGGGGYGDERRHERRDDNYGGGQSGGSGGRYESDSGYSQQFSGGSAHGQSHQSGGGGYGSGSHGDYDEDEVRKHAQQYGGGQDSSLFSSALGFLGQNKHNIAQQPLDEGQMVSAHSKLYGSNSNDSQGQHDSQTIGAGAAMQALKMFSGGGAGQGGMGSQGGGNSQNQFLAMAMGQAGKMFDQQAANGNVAPGQSKNSAVEQAGKMALQMYMKSGGQGGGGGAGGLLSLASKFM